MHVRMVQLTAKPGQVKELAKKLTERGLPLLKQQPGFVDAMALTSNTNRDQLIGLSIWKTAEDAEKWVNGQGREILESVTKPLLRQEPTFQSFTLEASTIHELGIGRAAGTV